jgi:predicted nucleotidyltransferase
MDEQLQQCARQIAELCRQYGVSRLEVFGSAVDGRFNPDLSDVD